MAIGILFWMGHWRYSGYELLQPRMEFDGLAMVPENKKKLLGQAATQKVSFISISAMGLDNILVIIWIAYL